MSASGRGGQPGTNTSIGHHLVHALDDRVVVEHAAAARAGAHGDDPLGLGHLVVDAAQHRRHLPRQPAGDDHQVRLARRPAEDLGAKPRDVVAAAAHRHHLDGAARQAERHRPDGRPARPLHHLLDGRRENGNFEFSHECRRIRRGRRYRYRVRRSSRTRPCARRRCSRSTRSAKNVTICQNPTMPRSRNAIAHGIEERDFDVEEQEDHRDEVELDRLPLARVADGRHAALVGRRSSRASACSARGTATAGRCPAAKPDAEADHDQDGQKARYHVGVSGRDLADACAPEDQATITKNRVSGNGEIGRALRP